MSPFLLVAVAFLAAPLAGWLGGRSSPLLAILPLGLLAGFLSLGAGLGDGEALIESHAWIPSLGVDMGFRLDGLSLLFALLITGIGTLIFLYASAYLRGEPRLVRFYAVLTLFMASMLGAVLADDVVLLVVFWELTSLTSFLLIGYTPEKPEARRGAQQGFLITVAGGLAMLAGTILLGSVAGTFSISVMLERADAIAEHPRAPIIIVLLALGAFAKSAQFPLHSWLVNAMVAPTPVSAFLHSATMVKLGVYLLARMDPIFGGHGLWVGLLSSLGAATMVGAAVLALRETDLKRVLAYSTVASLGTLVMLIGIPGTLAAVAAMTFLVAHALYKACLFMVAGIVDHETGTRDSSALSGLRRHMPVTAAAALVGGLSMAGLPPFFGFLAKEALYETGLGAPSAEAWPLIAAALVANAALVVVAGIVGYRCFAGPYRGPGQRPHDPGATMLAGPALFGVLGLLFGLAPGAIGSSLILPAASAVAGQPIDYTLSLWHGFTPMLVLSVATLALGVLAYSRASQIAMAMRRIDLIDRWSPDRIYDRLIVGLQRLARWQTEAIQTGSLRVYVGRMLALIATGCGVTLLLRDGVRLPSFADALVPELVLVALLAVSAVAVLGTRNFVAGIVAAGMVGFSIALIFLFQGAPDLAFTQFSVEALAMVILLAIVGRLPFRELDYRTAKERRRDAAVAIGLGVVVTLIMLSMLNEPFDARLSDYFRATSVPEAHGRNLVNVIIVDFRALDTLGEITVLGLAAIAAAAVLAGLRLRNREGRT